MTLRTPGSIFESCLSARFENSSRHMLEILSSDFSSRNSHGISIEFGFGNFPRPKIELILNALESGLAHKFGSRYAECCSIIGNKNFLLLPKPDGHS